MYFYSSPDLTLFVSRSKFRYDVDWVKSSILG
jgi:hypothetical protein